MLSEAALKQLSAKSSDFNYDFDLSTIDVSYYEPLFRKLQKFAISNVSSLGFNCSQLFQYRLAQEHDKKNIEQLPSFIESSIAYQKNHYARNIIELFSFVVPRSTTLQEIRLSYIIFRKMHIERLSTIIGNSKTIKSLILFHVPLGDDKVRALLNGLNPNTISHITIVSCELTGACISDILQFIRRRMDPKNGIQSFEVSSTEFCEADRRRIIAALLNCEPEEVSNQSKANNKTDSNNNNDSDINNDNNSNSNIQNKSANDIFTNKNELTEINDAIDDAADDFQDNENDILRRSLINKLEEENQQLEAQITALKELANAEKIGSSLFAAGPGSKKFISYLNTLEQQLIEIDKTPRRNPY